MPYRAPVAEMRFLLEHVLDAGRLAETDALRRRDARDGRGDPRRGGAGSPRTCWRRSAAPGTSRARGSRTASCAPRRASPRPTGRSPRAAGSASPPTREHGGMGLPVTLLSCVGEMFSGANMALSLCPLLTQGQIEALEHHAPAEVKALYLPKLVAGDLDRHDEPDRAAGRLRRRRRPHPRRAAARTAATPSAGRRSSSPGATTTSPRTSATWCWRGCRTARRAPRGISLFLVPKFVPDAAGRPGRAQRGARAVARAQDGPARQPHLRHGVRPRHAAG